MRIDKPGNGGDWVSGGELQFHDVFATTDHKGAAPIGAPGRWIRLGDKLHRRQSIAPRTAVFGGARVFAA